MPKKRPFRVSELAPFATNVQFQSALICTDNHWKSVSTGKGYAYSSDRVIERQVADRELLVTKGRANVTAVEDQVAEESAGAILHEDTLMLIASCSGHLEDDVHQGSCLGNLPMNTGSAAIDLAQVDDEVANRAEATKVAIRRSPDVMKTIVLTSCLGSRNIASYHRDRGQHLHCA